MNAHPSRKFALSYCSLLLLSPLDGVQNKVAIIVGSQISQKFTTSFAILAMLSALKPLSGISPSQTFQLEALKNMLASNSRTQAKMGNFSNYKYSRVAGHILAPKPLQELYCKLNVHEGQSEYSEFAKYLHKVPASVVRDVAEACYLSNLAYKISEIKEEFEIQHFRHLTLVTTSWHKINRENNAASNTGAENLSDPRGESVMDFSGGHVGVKNSMSAEHRQIFENDNFSSGTKTSGNAVSSHLQDEEEEEEARLQYSSSSDYSSNIPCDWFVCDKRDAAIRIFAIQGSQSMASWKANLLFQPTHFEDERLGVMVHAGVYKVAKALYDQMLPLVQAHQQQESGGNNIARILFTGHSLGGSLAELLALMFTYRGVIGALNLCPIYTFDAPCILSGGVQLLLKRVGLPPTHIHSVIMSYDLVPRIFSCDIPEHIIQVLKHINDNFRNYMSSPFLQRRRHLYSLSGHLLILQADVLAPSHPLLPLSSGLYSFNHKLKEGELRAAQRRFLNTPHPLEIVSTPSAYGSYGGICRFHDPRSYLLALELSLQQASFEACSLTKHK